MSPRDPRPQAVPEPDPTMPSLPESGEVSCAPDPCLFVYDECDECDEPTASDSGLTLSPGGGGDED